MHGNAIVRFIFILSLGKAVFGERRGKVVDIGGRMNKIAVKFCRLHFGLPVYGRDTTWV